LGQIVLLLRAILRSTLILAALSSGALASEETDYVAWLRVDDLVRKCSAPKAWEIAYCIGYVVGVADVANNDPTDLKICIPRSVTQAQLKAVIAQYFAQHPEDSNYAAFSSVRIALRARFPCAAH
jgi:hypothetical protein